MFNPQWLKPQNCFVVVFFLNQKYMFVICFIFVTCLIIIIILVVIIIYLQTSFALAVGEQCFEFEHRDLHWGNVLVMKTTDKYAMFTIESETYKFPTFGVKVCSFY